MTLAAAGIVVEIVDLRCSDRKMLSIFNLFFVTKKVGQRWK